MVKESYEGGYQASALGHAIFTEADNWDELKENVFKWARAGSNLFLYSNNSGNGKTTWATKIFLQFVFEYARLMAVKRRAELPQSLVRCPRQGCG